MVYAVRFDRKAVEKWVRNKERSGRKHLAMEV